jgi:hypothetical protein
MSAWLDALRTECARTSQTAVAEQIGMSATVICQVLSGKYPGRLANVQQRVEGALLKQTVVCPVLGTLPRNECLDHQQRKFAATNAQRVNLWRACRAGCPHSEIGRTQ